MIRVEVLQGFDHGGSRRKGDIFSVSDSTARALAAKGLVRFASPLTEQAAGAQSSASPAAQASPVQTAKPSRSGGKKRAPAGSS